MATTTGTATEMQFADQFKKFIEHESDPQLRELREKAFTHFSQVGFPTPHLEDWKYTNVAAIGRNDWAVVSLPGGGSLPAEDFASVERFAFEKNGFTALNAAFGDYRVITVPKGEKAADPIALNLSFTDGAAFFQHVIIRLEAGSEATIIESYSSTNAFTNSAVQFVVGDNAGLTHYRIQKDDAQSFNVGTTLVTLGRDSRYNSTNINLGAAISRHDINVKFTAEGGEAWVDGLYMLSGSQHSDTHSVIDHTVRNCVSHQTYKGVLNDKSRGVFNGIVFVRENASGTDAQQSNKNLLLSNEARVDTKPQLEIFNDDVKCSHGATVGQLEDEELFYLLTRGLPESLARNLLTYGFAEEIINKIGIDSIKSELDGMVLNRLNATI